MKQSILAFIMLVATASCAFAQGSRDYIKKNIQQWGSCRNVTITDTGGDIALNYKNQYAFSNIPSGLARAIKELHDDGELIDDIQLTEGGSWLILYGNNGFRWSGIPDDLEDELREYNSNGEVVTSVTFNDQGDWIMISTEHVSTSSSNVDDWIEDGIQTYGSLWAAHLTNDGVVLCYDGGYRYYGNVSERLKKALAASRYDVYRIKFTSRGSYFFADKKGHYSYWM